MKTHNFMKRILTVILCLSMILSVTPVFALAANPGTIYGEEQTISLGSNSGLGTSRESNFNEDWKFYYGTSSTAQNPSFNDSSWTSVNLPHDFSIIQAFTTSSEGEAGFLPGGTGWYRKTFTLPTSFEGKTLVLNFDGVYSSSTVYVNGTQIGENHYGYNSFAFDITNYVTCDGETENVIAVKAVNNIPSSRWYSGSGIYRDVTLIATDPVHVAHNGTYVTTPNIANGNGTVKIETDVANDSASAVNVTVRQTIFNSSDEQVAVAETTSSVAANTTKTVTVSPVVSSPALWSPETPNLYNARTEIIVDGKVTDTYDTTFGFRYYRFESNTGFYLNGEALKLNGVCLHHDQGALGSAAYYDAMYRQLIIMKDMGVNAVRTSHNPCDAEFIDICNEIGLLVIEEAFDGWDYAKNSNSNDFNKYFKVALSSSNNVMYGDSSMTWAEFAIQSMVRRDRNDPSIFMWSIGNEVGQGTSSNGSTFANTATQLINWIKEIDTTRQTTIGSIQWTTSGNYGNLYKAIVNAGGIPGFNYANVYGSNQYSSLHNAYGAIYGSETGSSINSRGIYTTQGNGTNADGKYHLTSYDTSKVSWGMTANKTLYQTYTLDYVAGQFVWTGFDYIGEPTPWNGTGTGSVTNAGPIPNSSYFGIVDTAGFAKDSYYLYRSQWNRESTTLHLVTAWDSDNMMTTSGKTPVVIYSNAPTVKLYRDDTLIGTATRKVNTTSAGHSYYTYTVSSNNSSICTASNGSGSTALFSTFNVAYTAGTIKAVAYDANGNVISETYGNSSVSTPGAVSKLDITQNKTEIAADGTSLVYIEVEVQDANGNLDTTATNNITFKLNGNGKILGVDNGDQATTDKFQQASVLTSSTTANIDAYAGKALVIVKSTKDAGGFTVNVASNGLTGGTVSVDTTEVVEDTSEAEGLVSYTMVRDYSVTVNTVPELLTTAVGTMADGSTVNGTIEWDNIPTSVYNNPGDYTVNGTLTFDGEEPIAVTARLHVIDNIIALRNISTATAVGSVPTLPSTVAGVRPDGTLSGEFVVTWDEMSASQFANVGDIVEVYGTATVIGNTELTVKASVRVAEAVNTESVNMAPFVSSLTQDVPSGKQSDKLESIIDGNKKPGTSSSARWTNYNNRKSSATAAITFNWATAELFNDVNLYYYYDTTCALPEKVEFEYSLDGSTFYPINATATLVESYSQGLWAKGALYNYAFDNVVNPIALRITFTQQGGTGGSKCVGLNEVEVNTFAGTIEYNTSALLSSITVDGTALSDFAADTYSYEAEGETVEAASSANAGITVLPALDNVVRILTISEDGSSTCIYNVTLTSACKHANTTVRNTIAPTCTTPGYTGDTYCTDCGQLIASGEAIKAAGHTTEIRNASEPTCTTEGYTGDTVCTICGETVAYGETIPTTAHTIETIRAYAATCSATGYTGDSYCTVCEKTVAYGEVIPTIAHTTVITGAYEATCSTTGYTGDTSCTVCGEIVAYGEIIPTIPHTNKVTGAVEPTCTTEGYTGDTVCTVCEQIIATGEAIPATHKNTEVINKVEPTCSEEGYTGNTVCSDCGTLIAEGTTIAKTAHSRSVINTVAATCTETGYTGDVVCSDCGEHLAIGISTAATGHTWDNGVVRQQPTSSETGIMLYTCTKCGDTYTEDIPKIDFVYEDAEMSVDVDRASGSKLKITGTIENIDYIEENYEIIEHGLVYMQTSKLGSKTLTINTSGRTKVTFGSYNSNGTFSYTMKPSSILTTYAIRSYIAYKDENGDTVYVYSNTLKKSYLTA